MRQCLPPFLPRGYLGFVILLFIPFLLAANDPPAVGGEAARGFLGFQHAYEDSSPGSEFGRFRVVALYPDGPAQKAGLRVDDRITAVNGVTFRFDDERALPGAFNWVKIGDSVEVSILRNGESLALTVTAVLVPDVIARNQAAVARQVEENAAFKKLLALSSGNGTELTVKRNASTSELEVNAEGLPKEMTGAAGLALRKLGLATFTAKLKLGDRMKVLIQNDEETNRLTVDITEAPIYIPKNAP